MLISRNVWPNTATSTCVEDILWFGRGLSCRVLISPRNSYSAFSFFSKTLFDFKKSVSGLIELKFSGKTPNEVLYAPIYFWGVYF